MAEDYYSQIQEKARKAEERYYNEYGWSKAPDELEQGLEELPEIKKKKYAELVREMFVNAKSRTDNAAPMIEITDSGYIVSKIHDGDAVVTDRQEEISYIIDSAVKETIHRSNIDDEDRNIANEDRMRKGREARETLVSKQKLLEKKAQILAKDIRDEDGNPSDPDLVKMGIRVYENPGRNMFEGKEYTVETFITFEGKIPIGTYIDAIVASSDLSDSDRNSLREVKEVLQENGLMSDEEDLANQKDWNEIRDRINSRYQY